MPYKRYGRIIKHLKNGRWLIKQKCQDINKAKAAIRILHSIESKEK